MTYQDRTFCPAQTCRHFRTCPRALTERVHAGAAKMGLPISQFAQPMSLDCYEPDDKDLQVALGMD